MRCQERLGPTWSDGRKSKEGSVGIKSSRETFPNVEERSDYLLHKHSCMCVCVRAQVCPTLWDPMDYSPPGPPSKGFSRQEYWSGLSFPSPGDLPDPGIQLTSPVSPTLASGFFNTGPPGKPIPQLYKGLKVTAKRIDA